MKITIIGSGNVGCTLGSALASVGHHVVYAERGAIREACLGADVVVTAARPAAVADIVDALREVSPGPIIIDAMNSIGVHPEGYITTTHAMADQLPYSRVVKCFNTVGVEVMANPRFGERAATMFMAGDDAEAKEVARRLATDIGFGSCEDVGGSNRFESLEHVAKVWISLAMMQGKGRGFAWHLLER